MHLQVKYGLITLINQEADGCDTIGKADLECPLDKGEMTLTKDVALPREIPPVRLPQSFFKSSRFVGVFGWCADVIPRAHTPYSPMSTPKTATRSLA
jgi:hypothetical protein